MNVFIIFGVFLLAITILVLYALCYVSSQADRYMENMIGELGEEAYIRKLKEEITEGEK